MEPDDTSKIFKDMRFYVQAINHSKKEELALKLKSRGAIEVDQPNHLLCRAIFVFATNVQPYIIKGNGEARPLETCLNEKTWTFHDLCTHFGRKQGDKEKRQGFVVDASWVDECIESGAMVQRERWSGKEILVKKRDLTSITTISTSIKSASPLTPASLMSTPVDSPATRQSTGTPTLETAQRKADTVDQVNKSNKSAPTRKGQTPAADEVAIETPGIFASFTKRSESFHVFPHKGWAKLVASINWFEGQVVDDIKLANYIIVDRDSAHRVPLLKSTQQIIDAIWIDHSLDIGSAQNISEYIIIPGDIPDPSSVDNKPQVCPGASSASIEANGPVPPTQSHSSITGRKRSATLTSGGPVAKMKRPGTPKAAQASSTGTSRAPNSVANTQDEATTVAYSLSGLFQIASENDTPAQKASRKYYVDQVVNELDEWCKGDFYGTRTAFLMAKKKDVNPEFDRVAFFSYNKKAILRGLSRRGRDIGLGSELYEGARRSGKAIVVDSNSSETSRPIQSGSSAPQTSAASATPKSSTLSEPLSIRIAPAPLGNVASGSKRGVNTLTAHHVKPPSSAHLPNSARAERATTPAPTNSEEKRKRRLVTIVDELDQWCLDGSAGSRTAHFDKMTAADPTFSRPHFFRQNKEAIFQALKERGRDISEGTKVYGVNQHGPRKLHFAAGGRVVIRHALPENTHQPYTSSRAGPRIASSSNPDSSTMTDKIGNGPMKRKATHVASLASSTPNSSPRPKHKSKHGPNISQEQKRERHLNQIVKDLDDWVQQGSQGTRTAHLATLNAANPGHCRISFFQKERDNILQALSDLGRDVGVGTKLHGTTLVERLAEARREREQGAKGKEKNGPKPNLNTFGASSVRLPSADDSPQLPIVRPTASSSVQSSKSDSRFTPVAPRYYAEDQYNGPIASLYDVPLPFPVEDWVTPDNE